MTLCVASVTYCTVTQTAFSASHSIVLARKVCKLDVGQELLNR